LLLLAAKRGIAKDILEYSLGIIHPANIPCRYLSAHAYKWGLWE
jgi:hypothetical protein